MLVLVLIAKGVTDKNDFIDAMGGPDVPVGIGSCTAAELADVMETILLGLTTPGSRVYPPEINREVFWSTIVAALSKE